MKIRSLITAIVGALALTTPAIAHHSSAPHFDNEKRITVTGAIKELKLVNPHAYLYFDVEQDGGVATWRCELSSATNLKRRGWTNDTFTIGQEITVQGSPARREENVCLFRTGSLDDGRSIDRNADFVESVAAETTVVDYSEDRPLTHENGQPNLAGPWVTKSFGRGNQYGVSPRYRATDAGRAASEGYDMAFDDPILRCHFVNIINGWNHDENINDIYQTADTITMQYGFMDAVRTVHLNMDEHPADLSPSRTGHSIGSWDGDTLVIDTVGFEAGILAHREGSKHSDQMHIEERIRYDADTKTLIRDYTVTDPLYLARPAVGQDGMKFATAPYSEYGCVELSGKNNVRPGDNVEVDEDGAVIIPASANTSASSPAATPAAVSAATPAATAATAAAATLPTSTTITSNGAGYLLEASTDVADAPAVNSKVWMYGFFAVFAVLFVIIWRTRSN